MEIMSLLECHGLYKKFIALHSNFGQFGNMSDVQLISARLINFKSFKDTGIIPFRKAFCSVVGPNGVGKSNFLDGIAFAFGCSLSTLRCNTNQMLIHKECDEATIQIQIEYNNCTMNIQRNIYLNGCIINIIDNQQLDYNKFLETLPFSGDQYFMCQNGIYPFSQWHGKQLYSWFNKISGAKSFKCTKLSNICLSLQSVKFDIVLNKYNQ